MKHKLEDLSPTAVGAAIKANLYGFFRYLSRSASVEFHATPNLIRWHTGVGHPWLNGVLSTSACSGDQDALIMETLAYFRSRNVRYFTWWFESTLAAVELKARLLDYGFMLDKQTPGMAVSLSTLDGTAVRPAGLSIDRVKTEASLREWVKTCLTGFEFPAQWELPFFDLVRELGTDHPICHYIGYMDGRPVATSNLFLTAGVAGIQFVGTAHEVRGRGIGGAMTLAPLLDARALGYHVGILQASDMGIPVYRRLGFQTYCQMTHYTAGPQAMSSIGSGEYPLV